MASNYINPRFPYQRSPDQDQPESVHHKVIIVGAGPSGLSAGLDLATRNISSVILDDSDTVSYGSRAICFAKRTLEIIDRYGCADQMTEKGVTWKRGKVFFQDDMVYEFDLLPEEGHKMPAFINLQQYYFEEYLVNEVDKFKEIDLRWLQKVVSVEKIDDRVLIGIQTPEGNYSLSCDYLLVCDGANSSIREALGLKTKGQIFQDKFLITDIMMEDDNFPSERWFWFDPPFHKNQSVLLHKQPDNVWRVDFQLGGDADEEAEKDPEKIRQRIEAMLGKEVEWNLEWVSTYTFQCRRLEQFIHQERILFIGDCAHQVSPFGARGANGAVQAVDNLCWKLARVLKNESPKELLQSYQLERSIGADENLLNSTRATDFITPKNKMSLIFRDECLRLAKKYQFARSLVNSGRLSVPCTYEGSSLNTPDTDDFPACMAPGSVCSDAPVQVDGKDSWLLNLLGRRFTLIIYGDKSTKKYTKKEIEHLDSVMNLDVLTIGIGQGPFRSVSDKSGWLVKRYSLVPGTTYLIRPDQHVCARWRSLDAGKVKNAFDLATGQGL